MEEATYNKMEQKPLIAIPPEEEMNGLVITLVF